MTVDLFYLACTAVLCLLLWIPYIGGSVMLDGMLKPEEYNHPMERDAPDWLRRCNRAHVNLVENLPPFAVLVLVAHVTGQANAVTATCAMVFFWARLAHAVVYIAGIPYLRTLCFTVGVVATLVIAWQVIM